MAPLAVARVPHDSVARARALLAAAAALALLAAGSAGPGRVAGGKAAADEP